MKRKIAIVLIILGLGLLLGALALFAFNEYENNQAGKSAEKGLSDVKMFIEQQKEQHPTISAKPTPTVSVPNVPITEEAEPEEIPEMLKVVIDGQEYIGYISIPSVNVELPVLSDWDYKKLKIAPCRYDGSVYDKNFVIAGHNYRKHFTPLHSVNVGDMVYFTDMTGKRFVYQVAEITVMLPKYVDEMNSKDWALTLFTCTYGGKTRRAIRCIRKES